MVKVAQSRSLVIKVSVPRSHPIGVALEGLPKGERAGMLLLYANLGWIDAQRPKISPAAAGGPDGSLQHSNHVMAPTLDNGGPRAITPELLKEVMNFTGSGHGP